MGTLAPVALLLLTACQRAAPPPAPDAVARIGETEVRYSELETYIQRTVGGNREDREEEGVLASSVLSELFDQFLDEKLLERLAVEKGLVRGTSQPGQPGQPRHAIDSLLAEGLRQEPGPGEVAAYYQAHAGEFARPERVKVRQILTEDQATADKALKAIAAGEPFEEVARRLSRDPSAATGGYQGELTRADLPPAFADVIFGLRPGEVSRLVPADYGVHIFQVMDRQPAAVVPLEQARAEILGRLRQERADRLLRSLVQDARSRYHVSIYERNLPFGYEGAYKESNAQTPKNTP